jgi:hypothetical protein
MDELKLNMWYKYSGHVRGWFSLLYTPYNYERMDNWNHPNNEAQYRPNK